MDQNIPIARREANNLVCVSLDVHLWSGRKRLRKDALLAKNPEFSNLPPESLATLGAIKICDPDDLRGFSRLKREAETLLHSNGLPFLGTVGIPDAKLDRVFARLMELQAEFDATRATLYNDFDTRINEWRAKADNKDWSHLISDIPTPEHVAGRLSFGFHMVRVAAPSEDLASPINQEFGKAIGGLKGELFSDAAREATQLMEKYLVARSDDGVVSKRDRITQKTLRPLKRVAEKLRSFSFLDPSVEPLAQVIEHCLSLVPAEGPIEGVHLMHIWTLANLLANTELSQETAAMAMQVGSPATVFEDALLKANPVQQAVDATAADVQADALPMSPVAQAATDADDTGQVMQFDPPPMHEGTPLLQPQGPSQQFEPDLLGGLF